MQTTLSSESNNITFFRSIQGQLIVWFLVLGLLPLAVIGVTSYLSGQDALQDATQAELEAVAALKAQRIEDWVSAQLADAESIAALPGVRGDRDASTNNGVLDIQRYQNDPENQGAYRQAHDNALDAVAASVQAYDAVDLGLLIAADGEVLVSTNKEVIPEGSNAQDIETIPFEEGIVAPVVSDVQLSVDGQTLMLVVMHPIHSVDDRIIGTVAIRARLDDLQSLMADATGLGETGETYLVDGDSLTFMTQPRLLTETVVLVQQVDTEATRRALSGDESGVSEYDDYRGIPIIGAWQTVAGQDWILLAEIDQDEAYQASEDLGLLILGIAAGSVLVIALAAYLIARTISRPLTRVTDAAVRIAGGDLTHRAAVTNRNEIGVLANAFNEMTDNLQDLVQSEQENRALLEDTVNDYMVFVEEVARGNLATRLNVGGNGQSGEALNRLGANLNFMVESLSTMTVQIREVASNVAAAAAEILAATTQQIASTTEQDAAVTQTMATAEEVQTTVSQTAERAQGVADASQESVTTSRSGQQAIVNSVDGMQLIRQQVESIAENILMLSERTQQIGEIIETVNEIADQSKMLALNASIEAARAGEEGKGFAVVAQEVRQLAEQSRAATARVAEILGEIQQATNTAVMVTEEGSKRVESGVDLVERAGEAIRELAATIEEAAQAATQIAASTQQQTNGMDQLTTAMASIQQASTQTAASTRQAEQSAKDLDEMAREMEQAVARYQL